MHENRADLPYLMSGTILVDLDGTLAHYDGWKGIEHIGEPVPAMLERVRKWMRAGHTVKIFTARVCGGRTEVEETERHIKAWCIKHFGFELPVTSEKDFSVVAIYDDRCVQVEMNTGRVIGNDPFPVKTALNPAAAWPLRVREFPDA